MSSIINFDYKGSQISFEKGKNVMVNLTSMAKPFPEKNLTQIINSQEINDYCISLSKLQNYSLADLLIVRRGGNNNGTWAHRLVAIRVAQKLNSDLAVWVDMRIEELLTTGVTTVSNDDEAIAYAMTVLNKRLEAARAEKERLEIENQLQSEQLKLAAPKVQYVDEVLQSSQTYTSTQVAKELGMREAEQLHKVLKSKGIMFKQSGQWMLTAKYSEKGYTKPRTVTFPRSDGSQGSNTITVWTERGRAFLHHLFGKQNQSA
ncbi:MULTISPECIES: phage antirepressor KilAC domain-containing protein [Bacteroides]|jgi:phage antirepressor YoqD-like protein|uniref:Phage antirepressor protein n=1 Tax=Bacteroides fragilis TaxID=817 RepID=A0A0I9SB09_BACFG|nr:phage antirepressor KilAC domain-containing protein [Bacteroides fragilis]DAZ13042.1 MAG TPA: antirepressor protein [Caudoviricetes sp.]MCE8567189.1 phage antirepressor KilAC domain-containing protein [Bacteroides fragilis]MCM0197265.1 phage antirepressor KilAC domain-containing protein [Bacteroides fragilis]MCM0198150.1 phage antirepressor KilAC domain-containing protein [Bacteroides fragilis]MCM0208501.1 phage antirepressor KilAC domain-containing protein [Bacteroides fragilis]